MKAGQKVRVANPMGGAVTKGCVAYTDHKPMTLAERKEEWLGKVEEHRKDLLKLTLTADDIRQIIKINYEIIFQDTTGIKCKDVAEEILKRFNQRKEGQ